MHDIDIFFGGGPRVGSPITAETFLPLSNESTNQMQQLISGLLFVV
jgi:hypothetical protein